LKLKLEIEVSEEEAKILKNVFKKAMKKYDLKKLLESILHQICLACVEAKSMKKVGIEVTDRDIAVRGKEIAEKALEDSLKLTGLERILVWRGGWVVMGIECPECHQKILIKHVERPNGKVLHELEE
jgi:hypothetical protein